MEAFSTLEASSAAIEQTMSGVGPPALAARQVQTDLCYRVSRLQTKLRAALPDIKGQLRRTDLESSAASVLRHSSLAGCKSFHEAVENRLSQLMVGSVDVAWQRS